MKSISRTAVAVAMAAMVAAQAFGLDGDRQTEPQQHKPAIAAKQPAQPADESKRTIIVSLVDHKLALVENGKVVRIYRVAVGKASTPSPAGTYTIADRVKNPTYYHHGKVIQPGPGNPVGNRWMGLNVPGYGIHGTNVPSSIGKAASHGCIRLDKADIEDLFARVRVGDTVELVNTRNTETAQIFGDGPLAPAAPPAQEAVKADSPAPAAAVPTAPAPAPDALLNALARAGMAAAANNVLIGAL
ncbi:MAG TPA: L,D-transpeptidase [Acidobacteriaceae bacterium]|nr:L,D-transpeptidase [Acidobacteriaceae bacterium]